jgi:hypothetical protein
VQQLREQKCVRLHTLEVHERELEVLERGDLVQFAREMRIWIPILYAEKQPLVRATADGRLLEAIMRGERERVRGQIVAIPANEKASDGLQLDIDNLTEKLFAYQKGEARAAIELQTQRAHVFESEIETLQQRSNRHAATRNRIEPTTEM